jgi:putative ABC transport system permease protein
MLDDKGHEVFKAGKTGMVHGPSFKESIPEIESFVRVERGSNVVKKGTETYNQDFLYVDDNFFSVFSFPLLRGDPKNVFPSLNSIVLSDETAKKYFGTTDVIGKTLELQTADKFTPFLVSAVAKKSPQNSSIKFDMLVPMKFREKINPDNSWLNFFMSTFLVLSPKASPADVARKMKAVYNDKSTGQLKEAKEKYNFNNSVDWGLQPLLQIHLSKDYDAEDELTDASNPVYSYILTGIAVFILLVACINFINLTVAQSLKRSKEIGIRKVVGGQRGQLTRQFLGESFIICFISFVFAIVLATLASPIFNELANKRLSLSYLLDTELVLGFIGLFLLTGFAAGFYPALVLSGFSPIQTLYNKVKLSGKNYLAKSLIVIQFALAALLIISTLFIYQQFYYLTHTELGYNDKDIVSVDMDWGADRPSINLMKEELSKNPSVQIVSTHNRGRQGTIAKADGKEIQFDYDHIDDKYIPTLQIPIIKGRNFSAEYPSDSTNSILVNETFAKQAGWENPLGKTVDFFWKNRKMVVVGVVKDYHFRSLKEKIGAQLFTTEPDGNYSKLYIKISPENIPQTLQFIEKTYKRLVPFYPFSYEFKNESNVRDYESDEKWKQIISFAAILTIFISCIGLLGLAALAAEQRTKEIGIRKVLGASISGIVQLVSSNFLKLVLLANIIALPIAWLAINKWLENFAYHISIQWWVFAIAVLLTLCIALFTVGFQAIKAAIANPVKSLRTE